MATNKNKPEPPKKATAKSGRTAPKVVKKTTKETATDVPPTTAPEAVVPLEQYDKLLAELQAANASKQASKKEVTKFKSWLEEIKAGGTVALDNGIEIGNVIGKKEKKFFGWAVAHWIYTLLGLAVASLLIWAYVLHGQRNGLQTKFDNCQRSKSEVQTKAASDSAKKNVTDLRSETSKIGQTPSPDVKKNGTK